MRPTGDRVLVFAKAPTPGHAKSRLIPTLGADAAAALHAKLVKHTLATVRRAGLPIELHGSPANDDFLRFCAERYGAVLVEQQGDDLGSRMRCALERALLNCDAALLIGTDCPALTPRHLRRAHAALARGDDAVFIPTEDGGYALVGLRRCDATLFEGIAWGGADVMAATRARVHALGWRSTELETLWDVDRPTDYERLLSEGLLEAGPQSPKLRG